MSISEIAKQTTRVITRNGPTILTLGSIAGLLGTSLFVWRGTTKASRILYEEEDFVNLTNKEKAKLTWKFYIPAALLGLTTIACIVGSNAINQKRIGALSNLYGFTALAFKEYKDKVVETIGKNKEQALQDEIKQDRITNNPPCDTTVIMTGNGGYMCYDSLSGRYFRSDINCVRGAILTFNEEFMHEMFMTVNELYFMLGLESIPYGNTQGWDIDDGILKVKYSTHLSEKGEPCLALEYDRAPDTLKGCR